MIKRNVLLGSRTYECFHSWQCLKGDCSIFSAPVNRKVLFPKFFLTPGRIVKIMAEIKANALNRYHIAISSLWHTPYSKMAAILVFLLFTCKLAHVILEVLQSDRFKLS